MEESRLEVPMVWDPSEVHQMMVVVGTRPEAIKMLPLIRELDAHPRFNPFVVSTGQHPGIVESILGQAGISVDADLGVGRPGLGLNKLFCSVLKATEDALMERYGAALTVGINERGSQGHPMGCLVRAATASSTAYRRSTRSRPARTCPRARSTGHGVTA